LFKVGLAGKKTSFDPDKISEKCFQIDKQADAKFASNFKLT
jgi:hypothetical protein